MSDKINAIVYLSSTGFTVEYARLLGTKTGPPVYTLDQAKDMLTPGSRVIYLGWLMAGQIKGYRQAAKRYAVAAVCSVGLGSMGAQDEAPTASPALCRVLCFKAGSTFLD